MGFAGYKARLRSPYCPASSRAFASFWATLPWTVGAAMRIVRHHRTDVINIHYPSAIFLSLAIVRQLIPRLRLVVSIHGQDLMRRDGSVPAPDPLLRWIIQRADAVVSPSAGFAAQCRSVIGSAGQYARVILNGVDPAEFPPVVHTNRRSDVVLTVASLDHWKGIDVLVRAAALLAPQFPRLRFKVVGEGGERSHLEALALEVGVADRFEFLGYVADRASVRRLLASCTIFCLPSRSEPFGLAAAEALAAGAPVVASNVGGLSEVLDNGACGVLVPPESVEQLAAELSRLLHDPLERDRLGLAGQAFARERLRSHNTGHEYRALYASLLAAG
jgi:glycosyltransferase involved in cell wall biosynthesis